MDLKKLIEENPTISITVKGNDLMEFGDNIAEKTATKVLNSHEEKIYSRSEVIEKFKVCSATLWRWDKMGLIQGKKIGNRKYYAESEIKRLTSQKGGEK